jgi:hypothetical protein
MTFDQTKAKADSFFEFPTDNKDHVTTTSAILFAMECAKDAENSPWLTLAHLLCTDYGVPQGNIECRLQVLQELLAKRTEQQDALIAELRRQVDVLMHNRR